jgi:hypothetical protein
MYLGRGRARSALYRVKREVEPEDMYAWLAEDAEVEAFAVLRDELTHGLRIKLAGTRDSLHLVVGCRRADVRVETTRRSGDQVDRYRPRVAGVGGAQRVDSGLDGGGQCRVEGPRFDPDDAAAL